MFKFWAQPIVELSYFRERQRAVVGQPVIVAHNLHEHGSVHGNGGVLSGPKRPAYRCRAGQPKKSENTAVHSVTSLPCIMEKCFIGVPV